MHKRYFVAMKYLEVSDDLGSSLWNFEQVSLMCRAALS